jgi:hypothetical protein
LARPRDRRFGGGLDGLGWFGSLAGRPEVKCPTEADLEPTLTHKNPRRKEFDVGLARGGQVV